MFPLLLALLLAPEARAFAVSAITLVSSRPDMASGGDALVRVPLSPERVLLNGVDVTAAFRPTGDGSRMGLVTGLREGVNRIVSGPHSLEVTNYPIWGPILSGPHETPFVCETEKFLLPSGESLGPALDAHCSVARRVDYFYKPVGEEKLQPLPAPHHIPADAALVHTLSGVTAPYVVRVETGVINRAIYQIAMLHDPVRETQPDFTVRPAGWNGRLIYTLGGGCPGGWYRQGSRTAGVEQDELLSQGYAVASATLNVFGNNCNDLLAAETLMMVKERFVEGYGPPNFTIGFGCSGGSYQAHQIADNYPGLLDGVIAGCSYPDVTYTAIAVHSFGARLLYHYFQNAGIPWSEQEQVAVSGLPDYISLKVHGTRPDRLVPTAVCDPSIPRHLLYDPVSNPKGARCTVYEHAVNVYGRDPRTGFVRRLLDNVGVQYGLAALNQKRISVEQFLDLNEKIGGLDADANFVAQRSEGDPAALRIAYQSGRILNGGGGLASTPIIDYRGYSDFHKGDIHTRFFSFSTRERLKRANGHARNHVMWIEDGKRYGGFSLKSPVLREALQRMDEWLTAIGADSSTTPAAEKVVRNKPAALVDACFDLQGKRIVETQTYTGGACNELYPSHGSPYLVAGMPLAHDTAKCQLKPPDPSSYSVQFSPAEWDRLKAIFPTGVCDYSRPGVGQSPLKGTWLSFGPAAPAIMIE